MQEIRLEKAAILILDKPSGMTSQQAVTRVKRLLGYKKAGHSGILDPAVTGVLPIFLGRATRLAEYLSNENKQYDACAVFGRATDTQDATGVTTATGDIHALTKEAIVQALLSFVGEYWQTPPAYSAIHVDGVRAYELARKGKEVNLPARLVSIDQISVLEVDLLSDEPCVRFSVSCSKGTYIRTLCHDLGVKLHVPAHMKSLIRTKTGPFTLADAHSFESIEERKDDLLLAPERAVPDMAHLLVTDEEWQQVMHGVSLFREFDQMRADPGTLVRIHNRYGFFGAIYAVQDVGDYGVTLRPIKVFMDSEGSP